MILTLCQTPFGVFEGGNWSLIFHSRTLFNVILDTRDEGIEDRQGYVWFAKNTERRWSQAAVVTRTKYVRRSTLTLIVGTILIRGWLSRTLKYPLVLTEEWEVTLVRLVRMSENITTDEWLYRTYPKKGEDRMKGMEDGRHEEPQWRGCAECKFTNKVTD